MCSASPLLRPLYPWRGWPIRLTREHLEQNVSESGYRMVFARRTVIAIGALILALIPGPGVSELLAAWNENFAFVHTALQNPVIYAVVFLLAVALLVMVATDVLVERRLARAGGITKREFPTDVTLWKGVQSFSLRDAIWLWHGLSPNGGSFENTQVAPTFGLLEEALNEGALGKELTPIDGDWLKTKLSRQQLVDLAMKVGQAPRFLVPKQKRKARVDPSLDQRGYESIAFIEYGAYQNAQKIDPSVTKDAVAAEVRQALMRGDWEAIGRERVDGILYPFERLPRKFWRRARRDFYRVHVGARVFEDVKMRMVNVARETPEP